MRIERMLKIILLSLLVICVKAVAGAPEFFVFDKLDETLKISAPVSMLASINGVDVVNKKYVLRLDQGDFDVAVYIKKLFAAGYKGPVGLQCYNIKGDILENLKASVEAWKRVSPQ